MVKRFARRRALRAGERRILSNGVLRIIKPKNFSKWASNKYFDRKTNTWRFKEGARPTRKKRVLPKEITPLGYEYEFTVNFGMESYLRGTVYFPKFRTVLTWEEMQDKFKPDMLTIAKASDFKNSKRLNSAELSFGLINKKRGGNFDTTSNDPFTYTLLVNGGEVFEKSGTFSHSTR